MLCVLKNNAYSFFSKSRLLSALFALLSFFPVYLSSIDTSFQVIHSAEHHVFYSTQKLSPALQNISKMLDDRIGNLQMELGIYPSIKVPIYIIPNRIEYHKLSFGKEDIVEFSDAFYNAEEGRIYIRSGDQIVENYLKILMHELYPLVSGTAFYLHSSLVP
jgi:isopentenyl phosphate kinase